MPLFVRVLSTTPGEKPEIHGPYPEANFERILDFARISSVRSKTGKRREVIWACGKRQPAILRVYFNGQREFPKGKRGDRSNSMFQSMKDCISSSGSACELPSGTSPDKAVKNRRRLIGVQCPSGSRKSAAPTTKKTAVPKSSKAHVPLSQGALKKKAGTFGLEAVDALFYDE